MASVLRLTALFFLTLVICEIVFRSLGYTRPAPSQAKDQGIVLDNDLGWRTVPGKYLFTTPDGTQTIATTILSDGSRKTGHTGLSGPSIELVGGSVLFGFGLADEQTMAWKLQTELPEYSIKNFGVNGYGTYQSYLASLKRLRQQKKAPAMVFYGFGIFHEPRNIGHPEWQMQLSRYSSSRNNFMPYCQMNADGACSKIGPLWHYPGLPLRTTLTTSAVLEEIYVRARDWPRLGTETAATLWILKTWAQELKQHESQLMVFFFDKDSKQKHYKSFLEREGIKYVDCYDNDFGKAQFKLSWDSHPNEILNRSGANVLRSESYPNLQLALPLLTIKTIRRRTDNLTQIPTF